MMTSERSNASRALKSTVNSWTYRSQKEKQQTGTNNLRNFLATINKSVCQFVPRRRRVAKPGPTPASVPSAFPPIRFTFNMNELVKSTTVDVTGKTPDPTSFSGIKRHGDRRSYKPDNHHSELTRIIRPFLLVEGKVAEIELTLVLGTQLQGFVTSWADVLDCIANLGEYSLHFEALRIQGDFFYYTQDIASAVVAYRTAVCFAA